MCRKHAWNLSFLLIVCAQAGRSSRQLMTTLSVAEPSGRRMLSGTRQIAVPQGHSARRQALAACRADIINAPPEGKCFWLRVALALSGHYKIQMAKPS
jgi:hypothetical protein